MFQSLNELADYIRASVPNPQAILQLRVNEKVGGVTFIWHGVDFFVKPTLNVLEVRGHTLYITGLSTLLQMVLMRRSASEKKLQTLVDSITQAEDLISVKNQTQAGIQLLQNVRESIERMVGK